MSLPPEFWIVSLPSLCPIWISGVMEAQVRWLMSEFWSLPHSRNNLGTIAICSKTNNLNIHSSFD